MAAKQKITLDPFMDASSLVDEASGLLAVGEEHLGDLMGIFEAIVAATSAGSLAHRLADLGMRTAENNSADFGEYKRTFNDHVKRLDAMLPAMKGATHGK